MKIEYRNKQGQLHKTDGPAIKYDSGTIEYWIDGKNLTKKEFNKKKATIIPKELFEL